MENKSNEQPKNTATNFQDPERGNALSNPIKDIVKGIVSSKMAEINGEDPTREDVPLSPPKREEKASAPEKKKQGRPKKEDDDNYVPENLSYTAEKLDEPAPAVVEENLGDEEELDLSEKGKANWNQVRETIKSQKIKIKEYEERLKSLDELEPLKTELETSRGRITHLENFELMYAAESNPKYRQKFIEEPQGWYAEATAILKDYGSDEEVMQDLLQLTSIKEINEVLQEHIDDPDARSDIKRTLNKLRTRHEEKLQFQRQSRDSLIQLHEEQKKEFENQTKGFLDQFNQAKVSGWDAAIRTLGAKVEGEGLGIKFKKDNQEYNQKIVFPVYQAGKQLAAQIMDEAIHRKTFTPELSAAIHATTIKAAAYDLVDREHGRLKQEIADLRRENDKLKKIENPGANFTPRGTNSANGVDRSDRGMSAKEAVQNFSNKSR